MDDCEEPKVDWSSRINPYEPVDGNEYCRCQELARNWYAAVLVGAYAAGAAVVTVSGILILRSLINLLEQL
jgi:hypothetical protein